MGKLHNKKRNVGIIYEQIITFICSQTIEGNNKDAKIAAAILKEHFALNTQLNKEYKLFKALVETRGISESLGTSIINEAKKACNYHFDERSLEFEKSKLIKELNYNLGKGRIFKEKVKNYKTYATIQTLLNEWRKNTNSDISITSKYENILHKHMISEDVEANQEKQVIKEDRKMNKLIFSLMNAKFSKKYSNVLNENQKKLISMFIREDEDILDTYSLIKEEALNDLVKYKKECSNSILLESFDSVLNKVNSLNENENSEENLKKFLYLCKLQEELTGDK